MTTETQISKFIHNDPLSLRPFLHYLLSMLPVIIALTVYKTQDKRYKNWFQSLLID